MMHCALYAEVVYLQHVGDVPEGVGVLAVLRVPGGGPVAGVGVGRGRGVLRLRALVVVVGAPDVELRVTACMTAW